MTGIPSTRFHLLVLCGLTLVVLSPLALAAAAVSTSSSVLPFDLDRFIPVSVLKQIETYKYTYFVSRDVELYGSQVVLDWSSIEALWRTLHQKFQPFNIFLAFYSFMTFSYIWTGALFILVEQWGLMSNYKIQPTKFNSSSHYLTCISNILFNYVIIIIPMIITGWPIFQIIGFEYKDNFPTLFEFTWQMCLFFVGEDFFEYWGHRLLHVPYLYKKIHKVHHEFQAPFGLSASYAHPAEIVILGMATFAPPVILRPHLFTFYVFIQLRQLDAVVTHCGYDLPFNFFDYLPGYGGTRFHDHHHTSFYFNYASRFTWVDKLFGTYKEPNHNSLKSPKEIK